MKTFIYLLFTLTLLSACKTAEGTAKQYAKLISKGDCETAILISTGEARNNLINNECNVFGKSEFDKIYCETGKTSATCKYTEKSVFYNLETEMETTLKLVKINTNWKVAYVNSTPNYINGNNDPVTVTEYFIKLMAEAKYDYANLLTAENASAILTDYKNNSPDKYYSKILSIEKIVSNENKVICKTIENRGKRKNLIFFYHLIKQNSEWKIVLFNKTYPKEAHAVTKEFVTAMANGNCVFATTLSTGKAKEYVLASNDVGCQTYESEIVSDVICDYDYNSKAECYCTEKRGVYGELTFTYSLIKINNDWKVYAFDKEEQND